MRQPRQPAWIRRAFCDATGYEYSVRAVAMANAGARRFLGDLVMTSPPTAREYRAYLALFSAIFNAANLDVRMCGLCGAKFAVKSSRERATRRWCRACRRRLIDRARKRATGRDALTSICMSTSPSASSAAPTNMCSPCRACRVAAGDAAGLLDLLRCYLQ